MSRTTGCARRSDRSAGLLSVLQRGKVSPGVELSNAAKRVSGSEMKTEVIGSGPQGARAKAQSSPPATFNLLIANQVDQEFHYLKSPKKLSRQWGVPHPHPFGSGPVDRGLLARHSSPGSLARMPSSHACGPGGWDCRSSAVDSAEG